MYVVDDVKEALQVGALAVTLCSLISTAFRAIFGGQISFGLVWDTVLLFIGLGGDHLDEGFTERVWQGLLCCVYEHLSYDDAGDAYISDGTVTLAKACLQALKPELDNYEDQAVDILCILLDLAGSEGCNNLAKAYGHDMLPLDCSACVPDGRWSGVYWDYLDGTELCGWQPPLNRSNEILLPNWEDLETGVYDFDLFFMVLDRQDPDPTCYPFVGSVSCVLEGYNGSNWVAVCGSYGNHSPGLYHYESTGSMVYEQFRISYAATTNFAVRILQIVATCKPSS
jgi:hypothetical protein